MARRKQYDFERAAGTMVAAQQAALIAEDAELQRDINARRNGITLWEGLVGRGCRGQNCDPPAQAPRQATRPRR